MTEAAHQLAQQHTIQVLPQATTSGMTTNLSAWLSSGRAVVLPAYGTHERIRQQVEYDRHDDATLWRGAVAGLINRAISAPWELKTDQDMAVDAWLSDHYHNLLTGAQFGEGWGAFVARVFRSFLRHDTGAFIEIIAGGEPDAPIAGPVYGLAALSTVNCYPTGDPEFPVWYRDDGGGIHKLHATRVYQLLDQRDGDQRYPGWGHCALSRAISVIERNILINRYMRARLDDEPPPGLAIFTGLTEQTRQRALEQYLRERSRDANSVWGRTMSFFSLDASNPVDVKFVPFSQAPDNFNVQEQTELLVNELALALGVDKLDLWEITSSGLGSGQQAEVMAAKSKGRTFGAFIAQLERFINLVLPDAMEFAFNVPDAQEDNDRALMAQTYANVASILRDTLSPEERRRMLANQVPAIADAITDAAGNVQRFDDVRDQTRPDDDVDDTVPESATPAPSPLDNPMFAFAAKDFSETSAAFRDAMAGLFGRASALRPAQLATLMRARLRVYGERAYLDGMEQGGARRVMGRDGNRALADWLSEQQTYIERFSVPGEGGIEARAQLWVNKSLREIYFQGVAAADAERPYTWRLGNTIEHCADCLAFNGTTKTAREWMETGKLPGSSMLECKGFQCDCYLEVAAGQPAPTRRNPFRRAIDFVRNLLGR